MIEQQKQRQRRLLKCSTRGAYATFMLGISRIRRVHAKPLQGTRKLLSHSDVINYKRFAATKHIQPRNLSYNSQLKFSDFSALFCIINLHCARARARVYLCVRVCDCACNSTSGAHKCVWCTALLWHDSSAHSQPTSSMSIAVQTHAAQTQTQTQNSKFKLKSKLAIQKQSQTQIRIQNPKPNIWLSVCLLQGNYLP